MARTQDEPEEILQWLLRDHGRSHGSPGSGPLDIHAATLHLDHGLDGFTDLATPSLEALSTSMVEDTPELAPQAGDLDTIVQSSQKRNVTTESRPIPEAAHSGTQGEKESLPKDVAETGIGSTVVPPELSNAQSGAKAPAKATSKKNSKATKRSSRSSSSSTDRQNNGNKPPLQPSLPLTPTSGPPPIMPAPPYSVPGYRWVAPGLLSPQFNLHPTPILHPPTPQAAPSPALTATQGHGANVAEETSGNSNGRATKHLKRKRQEKNRESARECRRRKKEHIAQLQARLQQLEEENSDLRLKLRSGKEVRSKEDKERNKFTDILRDLVHNGSAEDIRHCMAQYTARYADYGRDRTQSTMHQLDRLQKLLVPTQVSKMTIWTLQQDDDFYRDVASNSEDEEGDGSLWKILNHDLDVTPQQKERILQMRDDFRRLSSKIGDTMHLAKELRKSIEEKNQLLQMQMDVLQEILTPKQVAKFVMWVTDNQACIHMLNKLWKT